MANPAPNPDARRASHQELGAILVRELTLRKVSSIAHHAVVSLENIMATVTVYDLQVSCIRKGAYVDATYKATREFIAALGNKAQIIEGTGEEIEESLLAPDGTYKPQR